jgi:alpha-L-fucosidase
MRDQVRELLTNYGQVDVLWFDFSYPNYEYKGLPGKGHKDWESEKLLAMIRELQPKAMVNNRLDLADVPPDMATPEQFQPTEWVKINGEPVVWEACQTFSGSWGYHRDETSWKSPEQLVQMLINSVACGGNLLMNVGPTARGTFDDRALDALTEYGEWMRLHSRSIYGCTQSEFTPPNGCVYTQNGKRLYVHVYTWPFEHLHLPGLEGKVEYAQLLNDGSEIAMKVNEWIAEQQATNGQNQNVLTLKLPIVKPDVVVPVIEVFLK